MNEALNITVQVACRVQLSDRERLHVINRLKHALRFINAEISVDFTVDPEPLRLVPNPSE